MIELVDQHLYGNEVGPGMLLLHHGQALAVLGVRDGAGSNIHVAVRTAEGHQDEIVVRKHDTCFVQVPLDWVLAADGRLPRQRRAS
jgi:hypothetical protein